MIKGMLLTIVIASSAVVPARAEAQHDHKSSQQNELVQVVRKATERYKDVKVAEKEGYQLMFGCVSGEASGAMGLHYVNMQLVNGGVLDPMRPQIVIYEPRPDGTLELIGADYLLMAEQWNAKFSGPPELMGQFFHLFTAPNRFNLPNFYTLHVWAWKNNPTGTFVNWHANVSCDSFTGAKN